MLRCLNLAVYIRTMTRREAWERYVHSESMTITIGTYPLTKRTLTGYANDISGGISSVQLFTHDHFTLGAWIPFGVARWLPHAWCIPPTFVIKIQPDLGSHDAETQALTKLARLQGILVLAVYGPVSHPEHEHVIALQYLEGQTLAQYKKATAWESQLDYYTHYDIITNILRGSLAMARCGVLHGEGGPWHIYAAKVDAMTDMQIRFALAAIGRGVQNSLVLALVGTRTAA